MFFRLLYVILFFHVCAFELTNSTLDSSQSANNHDNSTQVMAKPENRSVEMERIIQPIKPHPNGKILEPISSYSNVSTKLEPVNGKSINTPEFKPSPQLEVDGYDSYQKFPVVPALPEPKHLSGSNIGGFNGYQTQYRPDTSVKWPSKDSSIPPLTTESPWITRVKFPTNPAQHYHTEGLSPPHPPRENSTPQHGSRDSGNNQYLPPYNSYNPPNNDNESRYGKYGPSGSNLLQPRPYTKHWLDKPDYKPPTNYGSVSNVPLTSSVGVWDDYDKNRPSYDSRKPPITHKTHYEYGGYDRPTYVEPTGGSKFDYEPRPHVEHSVSPWKKIIKILTAFIPIGLLISALTPTVITVTPMNNTVSQPLRLRTDDPKREAAKRLISSLTYFNNLNGERCEDRILCELLLSASNSKNAEQHVRNLLNNFTEQDETAVDRMEDMKKIFDAVQAQDCSPIECNTIKGTT